MKKTGLSLIEVLLAIVIISSFTAPLMIVMGRTSRSGLMFYQRTQAANLARSRMAELIAAPDTPETILSGFNDSFEIGITGFPEFNRFTKAVKNGRLWSLEVEVGNGGSMGPSVEISAFR
ncbi:MAG: prepilin-type N-terminal cleavage/methylation domain-containing protein [Candidatus Wallbacteria bacterium]|nr:prepilin-type N-terminal cleavage/methylation domain-containing protein [Candidatus Wallbacteria bacterium]